MMRPLRRFVCAMISALLLIAMVAVAASPALVASQKTITTSSSDMGNGSSLPRGKPDVALMGAWARLEREALDNLKVFWRAPVGTPEAIYGSIAWAAQYGADLDGAARAFIGAHSDLFKVSDPAHSFALDRRVDSPGGAHFYYRQILGGLTVFGRELALHIDPAGIINAITNNYEPNLKLDETSPRLSADQVLGQMVDELGMTRSEATMIFQPRRELGVYVSDGTAYLAWRLIVGSYAPPATWEAYYDALTGRRLAEIHDRSCHVDGVGRVFIPNAVVATRNNSLRDLGNSAGAVPGEAYSGVPLLALDGSGSLTGPYVNTRPMANRVVRSNNDFTDLNRNDRGFEEVEAYWAIDTAQRYIRSYGITTAAAYSLAINVHAFTADDSFYSGFGNGQGQISFGDGGVDDAEDAEVIWHEYGHAVLDNQRINMDQNVDGMGEGFSDYQAATLSTTVPGDVSYYPTLAEWDATSYRPGNPPFLRRVDSPAHYPENRSRDPHVTGMIWSATLWEIHNAIGREAADQTFYEGNFLLPLRPTLPQAAQAYLQADRNLKGGEHQTAMTDSFTKRGLIGGPEPSITVRLPNGGESWRVGQAQPIMWTAQGVFGNVRIQLSRNGGLDFTTIIGSVANSGTTVWVVTGPASSQCRIQVLGLDDLSVRDSSDGVFSITP